MAKNELNSPADQVESVMEFRTESRGNKAIRGFSVVKKAYPAMHIQPTKGSKEQAEDYINKRGKWQEKGEKIICIDQKGEIKGSQGQRSDLEIIEELLQQGKNTQGNHVFVTEL